MLAEKRVGPPRGRSGTQELVAQGLKRLGPHGSRSRCPLRPTRSRHGLAFGSSLWDLSRDTGSDALAGPWAIR
eukprot:1680825-Rhodomonas_salina.1